MAFGLRGPSGRVPVKIPKATDADREYFRSLFVDRPDIEVRSMFGNLAAFVLDNQLMCCGLMGSAVGVRLPEDQRKELSSQPGAAPFGPEGRPPMKEYVALPPDWREDSDVAGPWIKRAIDFTKGLPAKKPAKKR